MLGELASVAGIVKGFPMPIDKKEICDCEIYEGACEIVATVKNQEGKKELIMFDMIVEYCPKCQRIEIEVD